jgi:hypothetical protein
MTAKATWTGNGYSTPLTNEEQIALGLGTKKRWYRFTNEPHNRLTIIYAGVMYRVQDGLIHDFGSIPWSFGGLPFIGKYFRKDSYPKSVIIHDGAYDKHIPGEEHVLWISRDGGETWCKEPVTRPLADLLLYVGILAEGGPGWVARMYYRAVSVFGGWWW